MTGLSILIRSPIEDARGSFARLFCAREFEEMGLKKPIVQINHSLTWNKGGVRGMHFQRPPQPETKIVMCLRGRAFDVAVDLRAGSSTFLRWHGVELSPGNRNAYFIPEGFAHGFQALEDDTELLYLHTEFYAQSVEGALNIADPRLGIHWPLPITEVSERDRNHGFLTEEFAGIEL